MKTVYNPSLNDYICYGDGELPRVVSVKANPDYSLILEFASGEKRKYNAVPLLQKKIYRALLNPALFMSVRVSGGTVAWTDDIDLAPEHIYEYSTEIV
jgi:hypothetical protein